MYKYVYNIYIYTAGLELRMSAQFSKMLWFELRMPAKWGILECRHMWHSKFQSWVRKPQYFPIFEAKTCHKQFIDWSEIYPKAFQVPSSTPSCMIRIAWGNHVYPSEGFYQNLEYIYIYSKSFESTAQSHSHAKKFGPFSLFPSKSQRFVCSWNGPVSLPVHKFGFQNIEMGGFGMIYCLNLHWNGRQISEQQGKNPWNVCIKRYPKEQVKHVK